MNIASGYSVASNYGGFNAKTSQTSSKSFTIPTETTRVEATVIGPLTFQKSDSKYDPFKDIAETGNVNFPEYMQTKTTPTRSDEEILKELEELAKEHAGIGVSKLDDERYLKLMYEYISSVSPDRESILKNSVTEIKERLESEFPAVANSQDYNMSNAYQQINSQIKEEENEKDKKEPIDYFIEALKGKEKAKGNSGGTISSITKNGDYYTVDVDYGGGKKTILNYTSSGEFVSMQMQGNNYYAGGIDSSSGAVTAVKFFNDGGDRIMDYDPNGCLRQKWTKEEGERAQEVFGTYNAAYDIAIGEHRSGNEAYNKAYDRLTGGVA